jgi:hypothetical protein
MSRVHPTPVGDDGRLRRSAAETAAILPVARDETLVTTTMATTS